MTEVSVSGERLVVEMLGWDKFWAFKSRVMVPLAHVGGVRTTETERLAGWRLPGTYLPGVITAGSYLKKGQWVFWAVHDQRQAVVIDLRDEFYSRLVVQVPDPAATIELLQETLAPVHA